MNDKITQWWKAHPIEEKMLYKRAAVGQLMFVRDRLVPFFGQYRPISYKESEKEMARIESIVEVISTHRSKSIDLPVYQLTHSDGNLKIILRDNFYNWKLSVISDQPIEINFDGLFYTSPPIDPEYTGNQLHYVYFEGFPRELIFGYYDTSDKCHWSAELNNNEDLWTVVYLILKATGRIKPLTWHKKE